MLMWFVVLVSCYFFFFKQKTAYEMRISDWSSDVCSSDLVGAAFLPTDGQANPADITQALAKGARQQGVKIFEDTAVLSIETEDGKVTAVVTDKGRIDCEVVVCCAGQ